MNREEFIKKWVLFEDGQMVKDLDELLSLPPAEGAEEISNAILAAAHDYDTKIRNHEEETADSDDYIAFVNGAQWMREFASQQHPPAEGAESAEAFIKRKHPQDWDEIPQWHIDELNEFAAQQQPKLDPKKVQWSGYGELGNISQKPLHPTAEGAGKTCHAKEMEYNHNMCAMQESCEKCEAYKVPTNEGDIAKTETDTGRIVDMPDLSQPTAEGAEEILEREFPLAIIDEDEWTGGVLKIMREFATLHAQRIADKMVKDMRQKLFSMRSSKEPMYRLSEADRLMMYGYHDCINELLMWTKPREI